MATVRLLCGPERSGRTRAIDDLLVHHWGGALLIVPTRRHAERRTEAILERAQPAGVWGQPIITFQDFVAHLLDGSDHEGAYAAEYLRIDALEQRIVLERAAATVRAAGGLEFLGSAAGTEGFLHHVERIIDQLKQAAVEPETFRKRAAERANPSELDAIVADLYSAYQAALLDAGAYDLQGAYWMARLLCEARRPAALDGIDTLLLDGFDDFTPSEFNLLIATEPHLAQLAFGLNYDQKPSRSDLHAITRETQRGIVETFSATVEFFDEAPPRTYTEYASTHLFWRDEPAGAKGLDPNIELHACHSLVHEVETLARRVKHLLVDKRVPVDRIAVVFRGLNEVSGTVRGIFEEFGIPVNVIRRPSLEESALASFLLHFFEAIETWQREDVIGVLTAPWFAPEEDVENLHGGLIPLIARKANIIAKYPQWSERLARFQQRLAEKAGEDVQELLERIPTITEACGALMNRVEILHNLGEQIPTEGTLGVFAEMTDRLIDTVGIPAALDGIENESIRNFETPALDGLRRLLEVLWTWGGDEDVTMTRRVFAARLHTAFTMTPIEVAAQEGAVACLDLESIRHLDFDYVFLAGVNEGEVPRPPVSNAIYSEGQLEQLRRAGIHLETASTHTNREHLLFQRVMDVPRNTLAVSWHTVATDGKPRAPSPFIQDLRGLFPELDVHQPRDQREALVPATELAACWRDLRNAAFSTDPKLQEIFPAEFQTAKIGAAIEEERHDGSPFGPYDGILTDPGLVGMIKERFGEHHSFSVNQIETYVDCPFRFYVERLLDIGETEEPDETFDARIRGIILHEILEVFHKHHRGRAIADMPLDAALESIDTIAAETFDSLAWRSTNAPPGVTGIERDRIKALLRRYVHIEAERAESQWKPEHFEVAFGPVRGEISDPLSQSEPFILNTGAGPVAFAGRIDRIDCSEDETRIIDYKSSLPILAKDIHEGRSLQLAVYALALQDFLMEGRQCAEAYFVKVGGGKRLEGLGRGKKKDNWEDRQENVHETIASAVQGIREGRFHPKTDDSKCAYCPATGVCRYEAARVERKGAAS